MRTALHFKDDKSDKFWWIENLGAELVVNFGKNGTIGRFQLKEFSSEDECSKETNKLIVQKIKKGYLEDTLFKFEDRFYFDDEEFGLASLTSHPNFREHFIHDFYYDCCDDEAPFGSDEGSDTLNSLEEVIRKKGAVDFNSYPQSLIEKDWDMKYYPIYSQEELNADLVHKIQEEDESSLIQSDIVTYAVAFAQIKITGFLNHQLKDRAILSIERLTMIYSKSEIGEMMIKDLSSFNYIK